MDKWFDTITESRWFMKVVALVLALLLFGSVYDSNADESVINVPGEEGTETVTGIPVKSYYDTDNLVVTGVPETVKVTLEGPTAYLQPAKTQKDFEVYVDLSDANVGKQRVKLQVKNLSDNLKATINPTYVTVEIQEKVTKQFTIEPEFNENMIAEGYTAGTAVAKPSKVKITGGKDTIDQISYVKATVELNDTITDNVTESASVTVLDKNLNKLDVDVATDTVAVTIPVYRTSKTVPIDIVQEGTPPDGVEIESITLDSDEAKITGSEDLLNNTENVRVEVDVSKISSNTELTLPVIISDGIKDVSPETVKATIKVSSTSTTSRNSETSNSDDTAAAEDEEETTTSLSDLKINMTGLSDSYTAVMNTPESGAASLTLTGTSDELAQLSAADFQLYIDLTGLTAGDHSVNITVDGPDNVSWKLAVDTANVTLTAKEA